MDTYRPVSPPAAVHGHAVVPGHLLEYNRCRTYLAFNLRVARRRRNLEARQLADLMGVRARTVYRWESGQAEPDFETLCQLCFYLGLSIDDVARQVVGTKPGVEHVQLAPCWDEEDMARVASAPSPQQLFLSHIA